MGVRSVVPQNLELPLSATHHPVAKLAPRVWAGSGCTWFALPTVGLGPCLHPSMMVLPNPCRIVKKQQIQRHLVMGYSQREQPPSSCCSSRHHAALDSDNLGSPCVLEQETEARATQGLIQVLQPGTQRLESDPTLVSECQIHPQLCQFSLMIQAFGRILWRSV